MRRFLILSLFAALPLQAQTTDCANAVSQADINICVAAEYQAADDALNAAYQSAVAFLTDVDANLDAADRGAVDALRAGQRAWITYRDEACKAEAFTWFGGSGAGMIYAGCQTRITLGRSADLTALLESTN